MNFHVTNPSSLALSPVQSRQMKEGLPDERKNKLGIFVGGKKSEERKQ